MNAPPLEGIALVTWDVDGTLYPTRALRRRFAWHCAGLLKKGHVGQAVRTWLRAASVRRRVEAQRKGESRVDFDLKTLDDEDALFGELLEGHAPDARAVEWLSTIGQRGIPQVALSDFPSEHKLAALGLLTPFHSVRACAAVGHWKPSPEALWAVEAEHQVKPKQHLHLGDRDDTDGEVARRAGCHFMLFKADDETKSSGAR